jgi:hypothetical protein
MRILALDPSLTCTGFATVYADGSESGRLIQAGTITPITPDGASAVERCRSIRCQVLALCRENPRVVVIETPFATPRGGPKQRRSTLTLPNYGISVGYVCAAADQWREGRIVADIEAEVVTVPADEWSRGLPSTARDPDKTGRVRFAASLYGREVAEFGAVSVAGNVADAILLAWWYLRKHRG